jgi:hypothetical protein
MSRWRAFESAVLVATIFGTAGETAAFRTAVGEARAHGWTWRSAPVGSCVPGRSTLALAFEARTVRTSRAAGPPHVLADGFRHLHEFVFAEFAVFIFVELVEHLGWIRRVRTAAAFFAASTCGTGFAFAGLTTSTSGSHFAHLFFCLGLFGVI